MNPKSRVPNPSESRVPNPKSRQFLGTTGVGVFVAKLADHFCSFARRMSLTEAPDEYICIASRATSMQMPHVMPCGSQAATSPFAARAVTKQSSLPRWPLRSQPQ